MSDWKTPAQDGMPSSNAYRRPASVNELTEHNVEVVARLDEAAKAKRTPTDRAVDAITDFCGRMLFVWVHTVWFTVWLVLNLAPGLKHFDPYPFQLLTLVVSLEAIFLSTFILISQNRQNRLAERRNHLDLQINLLSEQENTKMLTMLESLVRHFDIPEADPEITILTEATEPERLVDQIEQYIEKEERSSVSKDVHKPS